jgi:hypothetical protein
LNKKYKFQKIKTNLLKLKVKVMTLFSAQKKKTLFIGVEWMDGWRGGLIHINLRKNWQNVKKKLFRII